MGLKEILDTLSEPANEKKLQKKADATLDFIFITIPKTIGKGIAETYSWMKDGTALIKNSIVDNYKRYHDEKMFAKLLQETNKGKGKKLCDTDYKAGEIICLISKNFYDKSFVQNFCNKAGHGPNLKIRIYKKGFNFHKGYCGCSIIRK